MIKRSTYIVIITFVAILFVWMQILMLNLIWSNSWVTNSDTDSISGGNSSFTISNLQAEEPAESISITKEATEYYLIAPTVNEVYKNISLTLKLLKIPYQACRSLDQLPRTVNPDLTGLIICSGNLDEIGDFDVLLNYSSAGVDTIFATLFDTSAKTFRANYNLFGIEKISKAYEHEGVDFLDNLLATGTVFDVEITTKMNSFEINGKCRLYACAAEEDDSIKYYDRPPVIWRTFYGDGAMYFVNTDIFEDFSFAGVFVSILSLDKDVFIYPIINTTMILVDALPFFSNENDAHILESYHRDTVQFQRDVLWGDLTSMMKRLFVKLTYYPHIGPDQTSLETKLIEYYAKEITLNECEWGYYPSTYFSETLNNYYPSSAMHYPLDTATNQITKNIRDFGYINDEKISLPIISQGSKLTTGDIFKAYSIASAFGYVCHYIDMKDILLSSDMADLWTKFKLDLVQSIYPFIKNYEFLDSDTASEGAKKMDIYLQCNSEIVLNEDSIEIKGQDIGEISYILRTNRIITSYRNCELTKIKNDVYMIKVRPEYDAVLMTRDEDKNMPRGGSTSTLSRALINWFS